MMILLLQTLLLEFTMSNTYRVFVWIMQRHGVSWRGKKIFDHPKLKAYQRPTDGSNGGSQTLQAQHPSTETKKNKTDMVGSPQEVWIPVTRSALSSLQYKLVHCWFPWDNAVHRGTCTWIPAPCIRNRDNASFVSTNIPSALRIPINVYDEPLTTSFENGNEISNFLVANCIRDPVFVKTTDVQDAGLSLFPGVAAIKARSHSWVALEQVAGDISKFFTFGQFAPRIITSNGSLVCSDDLPFVLSSALKDMSSSAAPSHSASSPHDDSAEGLWLQVTESGEVLSSTSGLSAKEGASVVDITEFSLMSDHHVPVSQIISFDDLSEESKPLAAYMFKHSPMTFSGGIIKDCIDLKKCSFSMRYSSPVWLSQSFVERYECVPRCEEVSGVDVGGQCTWINMDEMERPSAEQCSVILRTEFNRIRDRLATR